MACERCPLVERYVCVFCVRPMTRALLRANSHCSALVKHRRRVKSPVASNCCDANSWRSSPRLPGSMRMDIRLLSISVTCIRAPVARKPTASVASERPGSSSRSLRRPPQRRSSTTSNLHGVRAYRSAQADQIDPASPQETQGASGLVHHAPEVPPSGLIGAHLVDS